jgi:hypothetical protein
MYAQQRSNRLAVLRLSARCEIQCVQSLSFPAVGFLFHLALQLVSAFGRVKDSSQPETVLETHRGCESRAVRQDACLDKPPHGNEQRARERDHPDAAESATAVAKALRSQPQAISIAMARMWELPALAMPRS